MFRKENTLWIMATLLVAGCSVDGTWGGAGGQGGKTDGLGRVIQGPVDQQLYAIIDDLGLTAAEQPDNDNHAQIELGQMLFFDNILSGNEDISCATCHHPNEGTSDNRSLPAGTGGVGLGPSRTLGPDRPHIPRNAPDVFNRGQAEWFSLMWDGRIAGIPGQWFETPAGEQLPEGLDSILAAQAMFPVTSPDEMRGTTDDVDLYGNELADIDSDAFQVIWDGLMDRLLSNEEYRERFADAYPDLEESELGFQHAANAIAAFEIDAFTFTNSPWDRFLAGDSSAMTEAEKRGALLFYGEARCSSCHSGNLMTDQQTHNICAPQIGPGRGDSAPLDLGRFDETGVEEDRFAFRTPPLRNVELSGPWMHDGAYTHLEAAVWHHLDIVRAMEDYDVNQLTPELRDTFVSDQESMLLMREGVSPILRDGVDISPDDFDDLMAFMRALTDPAARDMGHLVPDSVPSGHPVDR